jgi:hypothetical protein
MMTELQVTKVPDRPAVGQVERHVKAVFMGLEEGAAPFLEEREERADLASPHPRLDLPPPPAGD